MILGKTTIILLAIAFTLDYLALLVCFCTATWQYDTFTFWLETYLPKHLVGKQKNNDSIATKEKQPLLQKPAKKMEGKTQRKENKKEKKAVIGRGKKTWHEKMAEQEKI